MAQLIQLKRSNTAGAVPTTTQLQFGEMAINTADGKMYIRKYVDGTTANDLILEISAAAEGEGVPLSSSATPPTEPTSGQIWFDVNSNALKSWDGYKWVTVGSTRSDTQPTDAEAGDLWFDSDISKMFLYDGTNWKGVGGGAEISSTAPANAQAGDIWYDSESKSINIYDSTGEWIPIKGGAVISDNAPAESYPGDFWYDSETKTLNIYDHNDVWNPIKGGANVTDSDGANAAPLVGDIWFDSETKTLRIYDGAGDWNAVKGGAAISIDPPAAPSIGDLWYDDSDTGRLYVYKDNNWIDAAPGITPDATTFTTQLITTGDSETDFALTAASDFMLVTLNGVVLSSNDYSITGTTLTLNNPSLAGQILQIYVFDTFAVAGTVSTNEDSTINAKLTVSGELQIDSDATFGAGVSVGTAVSSVQNVASATGNVALDFGTFQNFVLTLTGNVTLDNPTTEQVGQTGFLLIKQDGTGNHTVSLSSEYKVAGGGGALTLSTAANAEDYVPYSVPEAGKIILGKPQLAFA